MECKERRLSAESSAEAGINRNIVECKGWYCDVSALISISINRNIVECKGKRYVNNKSATKVLIET